MDNTRQFNTGQPSTQEAPPMKEQMKQKADETARRWEQRGEQMLENQKNWACEELHHFGTAFRRAGESLHQDNDDKVAGVAEGIADQIDSASDYLDRRNVRDLYHDAECLTRERPELVLGGLFIAGLVAGRFLKSSSRSERAVRAEREPLPAREDYPTSAPLYAGTPKPAGAPTSDLPYGGAGPNTPRGVTEG